MCEFDPRCSGSDDLVGRALSLIADGRWAVTGVFGDQLSPPIAYTTGLTEFGLPELVITGIEPGLAGKLVNTIGHEMRKNPEIGPGTLIEGLPCEPQSLIAVEVIDAEPLRLTRMLYGERFRALQLVWPDSSNLFPWERRHPAGRGRQPMLGVPVGAAA